MSVYIGIDPGAKGGFAFISDYGAVTFPWDDAEFIRTLRTFPHDMELIAFVEKVSAMPGNGVTGMFKFGKSAGFIEGVLSAMNIPYQLVPPQTWKKEYSLNHDKDASITVCERLFPNVNLLRTERCTTKHDGMAEALLIAEYARRKSGAGQRDTSLSQSVKER